MNYTRAQLINALVAEWEYLCHDDFDPEEDQTPEEYREDLIEMSIEELQNFARRMDNLGLDYCTSNEEALDVIAIEFERLVTLST